uniref:Uncharacterized protein n=1 Tax=Physcomitrium patens TaxID=3218 RepID=A0A2K1JS33_PHYPA|nr:hypothetical protein PHYPA_016722 [Physcomitrium patens]
MAKLCIIYLNYIRSGGNNAYRDTRQPLFTCKDPLEMPKLRAGSNHRFSGSSSFSIPWRVLYKRNEGHDNIVAIQHSCLHYSSTSAVLRTSNQPISN